MRMSLGEFCAFLVCPRASYYMQTNRMSRAESRLKYYTISRRAVQQIIKGIDNDKTWDTVSKKTLGELAVFDTTGSMQSRFIHALSLLRAAIHNGFHPVTDCTAEIATPSGLLEISCDIIGLCLNGGVWDALLIEPWTDWGHMRATSLSLSVVRQASLNLPLYTKYQGQIKMLSLCGKLRIYPSSDINNVSCGKLLTEAAEAVMLKPSYPTASRAACQECIYKRLCPFGGR